jgi:hypothetical protein
VKTGTGIVIDIWRVALQGTDFDPLIWRSHWLDKPFPDAYNGIIRANSRPGAATDKNELWLLAIEAHLQQLQSDCIPSSGF